MKKKKRKRVGLWDLGNNKKVLKEWEIFFFFFPVFTLMGNFIFKDNLKGVVKKF